MGGVRYAFPVMTRYLVLRGGRLYDARERDRLLYWYVHSFLWGRFAGSTETVLNQDLGVLEPADEALDRLIAQLRLSRGSLEVRPEDFAGWSLGARFYPMLYLLTRVSGSLDWGSGAPLGGGGGQPLPGRTLPGFRHGSGGGRLLNGSPRGRCAPVRGGGRRGASLAGMGAVIRFT